MINLCYPSVALCFYYTNRKIVVKLLKKFNQKINRTEFGFKIIALYLRIVDFV